MPPANNITLAAAEVHNKKKKDPPEHVLSSSTSTTHHHQQHVHHHQQPHQHDHHQHHHLVTVGTQHVNTTTQLVQNSSNWITTPPMEVISEQQSSPIVRYSVSTTTTTGFDEHLTVKKHAFQKRYKFKNSEISSYQSAASSSKKQPATTIPKLATCHEHYVISSQQSLDLDDYSEQFHEHSPFELLTIEDQQLNSTTIIKINPEDLNRRLTCLKRGADSISKEEILRVLHLNQQQASVRLGCSVSTLKRKFYILRDELRLTKWPNNYYEYCQKNPELFKQIYPMSLSFILNDDSD